MPLILLVEDEEVMYNMYKIIFEREGYELRVATDGVEGVAMAKELKPDLILLDVMMPRMDGLQALGELKKDPTTKPIPVIILTNLASAQDATLSVEMGAAKYVVKSELDPPDLIALVRSYIAPPYVQIQQTSPSK